MVALLASLAPFCLASASCLLVVGASFVELFPGSMLPLRPLPSADFSSLARRKSSAYEGFIFPVAFDQAEVDMLKGGDQNAGTAKTRGIVRKTEPRAVARYCERSSEQEAKECNEQP